MIVLTGNTPEQRAEALGFPIPENAEWPYKHFDAITTVDNVLIDFSGIPGQHEDGRLFEGIYVPNGSFSVQEVADAGKRAIAFGLGQFKDAGYNLSIYRPYSLLVLIGCPPTTKGLGLIANELSEFLLTVLGVDMNDPSEAKGVRATTGTSMSFIIEPVMRLVVCEPCP